MKTLTILFFLSCAAISAQTNKLVSLDKRSPEEQLAAVKAALPQYFETTKDPVTGLLTIDQPQYDISPTDGGLFIDSEAVVFISSGKTYPEKISIHLHSKTDGWKFLDNHDFAIRYDDKLINMGSLEHHGKIQNDGTVTEGFWADFTPEQFHDIAWGTNVYCKLGYQNFEIKKTDRTKWKLLWKYCDLEQKLSKSDAALQKAIGE